MFGIFDIYLLEALLNGVLLGGVFALLALGLNLIFGVIDVVWICYAELIMLAHVRHVFHVRHLSRAVPVGGQWSRSAASAGSAWCCTC